MELVLHPELVKSNLWDNSTTETWNVGNWIINVFFERREGYIEE